MREEERFIRKFREIQPKFSRFYARLLIEADMTLPQFALLSQLAEEEALSMTEAGRKLHITKPAVTHLVDRLEQNGFLKRGAYPGDRRISLLQIESKGRRVVRATQTQALRLLLKTLNQFSAREQRTIARFYGVLSQTLDERLVLELEN